MFHHALRSLKAITFGAVSAALIVPAALAANPESVVVEAEFVAPITLTENNPLQFGLLDVNLALSETVVIGTNDVPVDAGSNILGGAQAAADLTVGATATEAITILVSNIVSGTGYSLGSFMCRYNGGVDAACDGAGASQTSVATAALEIGATMTGDGLAVVGLANGSFDVTVSYQ